MLRTEPYEFALLESGGAIGGIIGGWSASRIARKIGSGPSLYLTLLLGGLTVVLTDAFASRDIALRMPFFVAGALSVTLFFFAAPKLTTERIEAARTGSG